LIFAEIIFDGIIKINVVD